MWSSMDALGLLLFDFPSTAAVFLDVSIMCGLETDRIRFGGNVSWNCDRRMAASNGGGGGAADGGSGGEDTGSSAVGDNVGVQSEPR